MNRVSCILVVTLGVFESFAPVSFAYTKPSGNFCGSDEKTPGFSIMKLKKIKALLTSLLMTVAFFSGNEVTAASSQDTFQEVVNEIPADQKEVVGLLNQAIAAGKKQQTDIFLKSADGLKLQQYLSNNTELKKKLATSTQAYKFLKNK